MFPFLCIKSIVMAKITKDSYIGCTVFKKSKIFLQKALTCQKNCVKMTKLRVQPINISKNLLTSGEMFDMIKKHPQKGGRSLKIKQHDGP